jgi:hypothetical protein
MPCDLTRYGESWKWFSNQIRFIRAAQRCECFGKCGLHRGRRCIERHHTKAHFAKGTIRLTVAHLCNCDPPCQDPNHVIAACQRCHLRIDRYKHAKSRLEGPTTQRWHPGRPLPSPFSTR